MKAEVCGASRAHQEKYVPCFGFTIQIRNPVITSTGGVCLDGDAIKLLTTFQTKEIGGHLLKNNSGDTLEDKDHKERMIWTPKLCFLKP